VFRNITRSKLHAFTGSRFARPIPGPAGAYLGQLSRLAAGFAVVSDAAMGTLGGALKRREKISGRFADALAWMYFASASVKRFCDDGQPREDLPVFHWSCQHALFQVQEALRGILDNLPIRPVAWLLRPIVFPLGARFRPPSDALGAKVARSILHGGVARERLSRDVFVPGVDELGLGRLEDALQKMVAAQSAKAKLRAAVRSQQLDRSPSATLADRGLAAGIITAPEFELLEVAIAARDDVIEVDAFEGHFPGAARAPEPELVSERAN
jgi:acyl-CoA dehydrogenase